MLFRIISVDHDGFCGREHHPSKEDIGKVVMPLRLEVGVGLDMDPAFEGATTESLADNTADAVKANIESEVLDYEGKDQIEDWQIMTQMWLCMDAKGNLLQLVDHEIELFRS